MKSEKLGSCTIISLLYNRIYNNLKQWGAAANKKMQNYDRYQYLLSRIVWGGGLNYSVDDLR